MSKLRFVIDKDQIDLPKMVAVGTVLVPDGGSKHNYNKMQTIAPVASEKREEQIQKIPK